MAGTTPQLWSMFVAVSFLLIPGRSTVWTLLRGASPSTGHSGKGFLRWRVGELGEENKAEIFKLGSLAFTGAPLTQSITVQARKNVHVLKVPAGTGQVSVMRN